MGKKNLIGLALEEMEQQELVEQELQRSNQAEDDQVCDVEQCYHDITEAESDIDDHLDYITDVVGGTNDVQNVSDFTEEASGQGGLDATAAEILEVSTERLYERLGVRPDTNRYAFEDYGFKDTKINSTKLAVEGFKEFIKSVWEAIKAAFKKMGMYLSHYVDLVFGQNSANIRYAIKLKELVTRKAPIKKDNEALLSGKPLNIVVSSYILQLSSSKNPDAFSFSLKTLQDSALVFARAGKLLSTFNQYLGTTSDLKSMVEDDVSIDKIEYPKIEEDLGEGFTKSTINVGGIQHSLYTSQTIAGSKHIEITTPANTGNIKGFEAIKAISQTKLKLVSTTDSKDDKKHPSNFLSKYPIESIAPPLYDDVFKTVTFISEGMAKSKEGYIGLVNRHNKMIGEIDAVQQLVSQKEEDYKRYKDRVSSVRLFTTSVNELTSELTKLISGSLVKSCHACLKLTEQSYRAYLKHQ